MTIAIVYRAPIEGAGARALSYRDENFADRIGWREVVARAAPGVVLAASSVPERDQSRELSDYPADLLNSPPEVSAADIVFEQAQLPAVVSIKTESRITGAAGAGASVAGASPASHEDASPAVLRVRRPEGGESDSLFALRTAPVPEPPVVAIAPRDNPSPIPPSGPGPALAAGRPGGSRSALTELMTRHDMGPGLLLFTLATAMVLGAFHALEPGHGKTVVAAYLVGSRGTAWHAVFLGLAVTVSHTAGVFLLGAVTLYASRYVMPDRLYPWLGAISGLAIAGVGLALLRQRWRGGKRGHGHDHGHAHERTHHGEPHDHPHHHGPGPAQEHRHHDEHQHNHAHDGDHHHHHLPAGPTSVRSLLALGLSGGIVPCPGALVVLLSALAWQRLGFGILLVVAFSVGLAAVLVAIGLLMVHARRLLGRVRGDGPLTTRWLPLASSAVITVLGVLIAVQALAGASIISFRLG